MYLFPLLDEKEKKELAERYRNPSDAQQRQRLANSRWVEALANIAQVDHGITKPLTDGLRFILHACHMDAGYIHILDQEKHVLKLNTCLGFSKKTEANLKILREGERIPGQVLQKGRALLATNIPEITGISRNGIEEEEQTLYAGFPLRWKDRVLGTLTVMSKNHSILSEEDVSVLKAFSQFVAVVVQNYTLFDVVSQGKKQWENVFDSISDLVLICDRDFRIVKTNKAILERFWIALEDAIGKECFELLYEKNPFPVSREKLQRMLRQGVTYHEEIAPPRLDGIFSIFVSPILTSGKLAGSVHIIKEITHEKLLEKDREELVRKVSLFGFGTITIDPEGKIRSWDLMAERILGYEEEEVKGKPLSRILSSPKSETLIDRLENGEGILDSYLVAIAKGERPVQVNVTLSAHRNQGGGIEEITIFIRDMTQQ